MTAVSYSNRANAKRAAEKMIGDGTAPAVDCGIKPRDDGRFEIAWKTGNGTPATTGEIETEITTATAAADPFARARDREEIEALGTTPEKYAFQSWRDAEVGYLKRTPAVQPRRRERVKVPQTRLNAEGGWREG